MIKAAFFDVDGTFYSHTMKKFPESTLKALRLLKEKGIQIFLSTGRSFDEAQNLPWDGIWFDGCVLLNGQMCTDAKGTVLYGNTLEGPDKEYLLNAFKNHELALIIVEEKRQYMNFLDEAAKRGLEYVSIPAPEVGEYEGDDIYQFIAYLTREEEALIQDKIPNCKFARWYEGGVDIIPKSSGKMVGIRKILEVYGIKREEIIAFGDGDNDADMMEYAGIGVAMGNAVDITKGNADYITDHIDEDGIWNALKHFEVI